MGEEAADIAVLVILPFPHARPVRPFGVLLARRAGNASHHQATADHLVNF